VFRGATGRAERWPVAIGTAAKLAVIAPVRQARRRVCAVAGADARHAM